jgi:succinate dehydrogenase / fumarate reductase, flavoprotein subunit
MLTIDEVETDVLTIGGGIAGIMASMEASDNGANVVLANKGYVGQDGAAVWMAGGGYQAALYPPDSVEQHALDTIKAGKFLNNQDLVYAFLSLAPESIRDLARWGVRWRKEGGKYEQILMPGQTYGRGMLHVQPGQHLGGEYRKALPHQLRRKKNIRITNDVFMVDLLKDGDAVTGAIGIDIRDGKFVAFRAKATILATGGFMDCFEFTTANPTLTGDGHGMAYRAGARMTGMEFIQFFPAAVLWPANVYRDNYAYGLVYTLRGILYNKHGERFMERYHPVEKDFVPREAMSRAIAREVREGRGSPHGGAYLSFRHLPRNLMDAYLKETWNIPFFQSLREAGVDLREDAIEMGPAAHYVQGGCWINSKCETDLPGLYAAGEVGSGGKDGADRLAGNALPFCAGMAYVAGKEAAEYAARVALPKLDKAQVEKLCAEASTPLDRQDGVRPPEMKTKIRKLMSKYMIFDRKGEELEQLAEEFEIMRREMLPKLFSAAKTRRYNMDWTGALEAKNMLDVSEMCSKSALMRTESRGLHERADYPDQDPEWLKHIILLNNDGKMEMTTEPVVFSHIQPSSTVDKG